MNPNTNFVGSTPQASTEYTNAKNGELAKAPDPQSLSSTAEIVLCFTPEAAPFGA
jgi:hypothetical protein